MARDIIRSYWVLPVSTPPPANGWPRASRSARQLTRMGPRMAPDDPASTWNCVVQASRSTLRGGWPHPTEVKADEVLEIDDRGRVHAHGVARPAPCRGL